MTDYTGDGGYYENEKRPENEFCEKHNIKPAVAWRIGGWECPCCQIEKDLTRLEKRLIKLGG